MNNLKISVSSMVFASACFGAVNAMAETKSYTVESFQSIKVSQGITVNVSVGQEQAIEAEGPDGKMDKLDISVKNGRLIVRRAKNKRRWGWNNDRTQFSVKVSTPMLLSVDVSSGADVSVSGVESETFAIDSSSGADVSVSGTCGSVSADASSGSDINADDLICETGVADVSSGADIDLHVTKIFNGDASSGGSIDVYGKPKNVNTDKSSGGSIKIR